MRVHTCRHCGEVFPSYPDLRQHLDSHLQPPNVCPTCKRSFTPTTCKTRPAGRVRPATLFCPAREMFLNNNGNRPAACHRSPLHYTIEGLSRLPLHRLKTNVVTTFIFFDNALLNARWIVWILISNDISVDHSFHL